ncbi:unnamed protein product [Camellia sinensis]
MFISKLQLLKAPTRIKDLCLLISSLFIVYLLLLLHQPQTLPPHHHHLPTTTTTATATSPTTLRHLVFSVASSSRTFPNRQSYLRLWHRPNSTRVFVFLDRPTSNSSAADDLPPTVVSADTSSFPYSFPRGNPAAVRIARIVKEIVLRNESDVRWFVFGDDDTLFFADNLVRTLSKYDHNQWYYVGSSSESYQQNAQGTFDMAYGGGGFAISQSLSRVLAGALDSCLVRYPHLYGSDARVYSCLAELGVGLTREPGFHQVDLRGNMFGMLTAHPLSPVLSLHHLDFMEPIFPNMSRTQAFEHLFKAVNVDPARVLQQTVCYDRANSLTVSVAWGYAVQVFEGNHLLPDLLPLQRTFRTLRRNKSLLSSLYMFNTREQFSDPCKRPVAFFLRSVASGSNKVMTDYTGHIVGNCSRTRAVDDLKQIRVFSQKPDFDIVEVKALRRQCCDILPSSNRLMAINIRQCGVDELISMQT